MAKKQPQPDIPVSATIVYPGTAPVAPSPEALVAVTSAATTVSIESRASAEAAANWLRHVRGHIKRVEQRWKDTRKPINEALKEFTRLAIEELASYRRADTNLAAAIADWDTREEERLRVEAREQLRLAEADAQVRRTEQVESIRAAATVAPTKTAARGLERQARSLEQSPVTPMVTTPVEEAVPLDGVYTSDDWSAEVYDFELLVTQVAKGPLRGGVALNAVMPDQKWLDGQAAALRQDFNMPGVRAVRKKVVAARRLE